MQSTWFKDEALPNTFYGKSENGKNTKIHELNTLILSLSFSKESRIILGFFY